MSNSKEATLPSTTLEGFTNEPEVNEHYFAVCGLYRLSLVGHLDARFYFNCTGERWRKHCLCSAYPGMCGLCHVFDFDASTQKQSVTVFPWVKIYFSPYCYMAICDVTVILFVLNFGPARSLHKGWYPQKQGRICWYF